MQPKDKPTIALGDDGTMDTVVCCLDCGREYRFNFDPGPDEADGEDAYDRFVDDCIEEIEDEHVCGEEDY